MISTSTIPFVPVNHETLNSQVGSTLTEASHSSWSSQGMAIICIPLSWDGRFETVPQIGSRISVDGKNPTNHLGRC